VSDLCLKQIEHLFIYHYVGNKLHFCDKRTFVWYQVWLGVVWALC